MLLTASQSAPSEQMGDAYLITLTRDSTSDGPNAASGSTHDQDSLVERVVGITDAGLELEYDLPASATKEDRLREWQFPARVLVQPGGRTILLEIAEQNKRLARWLKAAKLPRAACGKWYFTWNAFKVECDPQTILKVVARSNLRGPRLQSGALYTDPDAAAPAPLKEGATGAQWIAEMVPDVEAVRRQEAQRDVVTAEILKQPTLSLEEALRARAAETITGTMTVTFDLDDAGRVSRKTTVTRLEISTPRGVERRTITETVERHRLAHGR